MAVAFGTPVKSTADGGIDNTGYTIAVSGVTTGQPILLFHFAASTSLGVNPISDNFSTPYKWTLVVSSATAPNADTEIWVGTGGAGTSGTITVTAPSDWNDGCAVPCTGASTASGLAAILASRGITGTTTGHGNVNGTTLDPSVVGAAIAAAGNVSGTYGATFTGPPGWNWTGINQAAQNIPGVATLTGITPGNGYQPTWGGGDPGDTFNSCSVIVAPLNTAPLAPTITAPGAASFQPTTVPLSFVYNPTNGANMNAFAVRRVISGTTTYLNVGAGTWGGSVVWNSQTLAPGASFSLNLPGFTSGQTPAISVATQESTISSQGPFASNISITIAAAPTVTPTAPSGTQTTSTPTVSWSRTLGNGSQITYQVRTFSAAQYGAGGFNAATSVASDDSGIVNGAATSYVVSTNLVNGTTYKSYVQIVQTGGQASAFTASSTYTISLTPPTTPTIAAAVVTGGAPRVDITVTPHGGFTGSGILTITRSDGTLVRGAGWNGVTPITTVAVVVSDYETVPGVAYTYTATLTASNGASANSAASASVTTSAGPQMWLLDPTNPSGAVAFHMVGTWAPKFHEVGAAYYPLGYGFPVKSTDGVKGQGAMLPIHTTTLAQLLLVEALIESPNALLLISPTRIWYVMKDPAQDATGAQLYPTQATIIPSDDTQFAVLATARP